jgi:predicted histidine transporter YuiF (NhaC family)
MAPAITFFILGFTVLCFDSVASYYTVPATMAMSKAVTDSMSAFADEKNKEQTDKLLDAMAGSIARALESSTLKNTVKKSIIETVSDDDLQLAAITTVQKAMKKAGTFGKRVFSLWNAVC